MLWGADLVKWGRLIGFDISNQRGCQRPEKGILISRLRSVDKSPPAVWQHGRVIELFAWISAISAILAILLLLNGCCDNKLLMAVHKMAFSPVSVSLFYACVGVYL